MAKSAAPSPLGALLHDLFRVKKWQQRLDQHALFLHWEEIVGPDLAERARPDCIRGDVLWLRVIDSVWMQQLSLQKIILLALLNDRLGEKGVKDIRFRLDVSLAGQSEAPAGEKPRRERPVSTEELREFEEIALPIKDEELKAAMRRFWLKCRRHQG
jgi:predicted nucleic acid-binding Zn ribbon protein